MVGNQSPEFAEALTACRPDQIVIDPRAAADRRVAAAGGLSRDLLVEASKSRSSKSEVERFDSGLQI